MPKKKKKKRVYVSRGARVATEHAPKLRKDIMALSDSAKKKARARKDLEKRVGKGLNKAIVDKPKQRVSPPVMSKDERTRKRINTRLAKERANLKRWTAKSEIPKSVRLSAIEGIKKRIGILEKGIQGLDVRAAHKKKKKGK